MGRLRDWLRGCFDGWRGGGGGGCRWVGGAVDALSCGAGSDEWM